MKFVIQRVKNAGVSIDGDTYSSINKGLLVFFCAESGDENGVEISGKKLSPDEVLTHFANKILKLRIFEDENGKMNRSLLDINGEILVVSQFTLAANCKKGNRPSFENALAPDLAKKMYEDFINILKAQGTRPETQGSCPETCASHSEIQTGRPETQPIIVKTGVFAADMQVSLINDGPVTIIMP